MKLHVWKNQEGLHLSKPDNACQLTEVDFDPNQPCHQCGAAVLSISADQSNICPWCESGMNRPKMLKYQEQDMFRLLEDQCRKNKLHKAQPRKLIGNRATEKDVRDYLSENGYYGKSANFHRLELAAIERPGWVQVFEFHVLAKSQAGIWEELFGTCRSDERDRTMDVQLFGTQGQQAAAFREDTSELITHDRGPRHWSYLPLMVLFSMLVGAAIYGAVVANFAPSQATQTGSQQDIKPGPE